MERLTVRYSVLYKEQTYRVCISDGGGQSNQYIHISGSMLERLVRRHVKLVPPNNL